MTIPQNSRCFCNGGKVDLQGYRLKSKSAAIDKGKSIKTAEDPRDFFGSPIKGRRVNLGAVE